MPNSSTVESLRCIDHIILGIDTLSYRNIEPIGLQQPYPTETGWPAWFGGKGAEKPSLYLEQKNSREQVGKLVSGWKGNLKPAPVCDYHHIQRPMGLWGPPIMRYRDTDVISDTDAY